MKDGSALSYDAHPTPVRRSTRFRGGLYNDRRGSEFGMSLAIGAFLGPYRVAHIGSGGMGDVYKAHDSRLDRTVALKVLPTAAVSDAERRRRLIQEARAASALDHPGIVTIYDVTEAEGTHVIIMQYVLGKTLRELIRLRQGSGGRVGLKLSEALGYAVQMADALAAAHSHGIVHRDLKPENVMVTEEGADCKGHSEPRR